MKIKQATIDSVHKTKTSDRFNVNRLIKSLGINLTVNDSKGKLKAYDYKDGVFIFIDTELIGFLLVTGYDNTMYFKSTETKNKLIKYIKSLIVIPNNQINLMEII